MDRFGASNQGSAFRFVMAFGVRVCCRRACFVRLLRSFSGCDPWCLFWSYVLGVCKLLTVFHFVSCPISISLSDDHLEHLQSLVSGGRRQILMHSFSRILRSRVIEGWIRYVILSHLIVVQPLWVTFLVEVFSSCVYDSVLELRTRLRSSLHSLWCCPVGLWWGLSFSRCSSSRST